MDDFAHLHLHTQYSLLDGAIRMKDLCSTVKARGMTSVAVTDHGNMYGAIALHRQAKESGIKPIFGCEAYLADGSAKAKSDRKNFHIVLLAKNDVGYHNLQRLVSYGHLEGFYYNPRIDRAILRKHREGLIGLSACLGGHISRLVNNNEIDKARATAREYKDIFEPGSYFLELQASGTPLQESTNAVLAQFGRDLGIPIVATADCHYVDRSEAEAHEVLMCIGMGKTILDDGRLAHECDELFIKTPEEMSTYFAASYPEAMENSRRIASMCNVELKLGKIEMPEFRLPEGTEEDVDGYLRKVARQGLDRRFVEFDAQGRTVDRNTYRDRLEYELQMISKMGYPGYFLIVWDFIREAKDRRIPVGPGRGSGAGSVVAYAMRITDIDPIRWGLMFERFLNPERVSLPDFDIDFCMNRRGEVIDYVTSKYGADHVGQITTFQGLKARGLVRDTARALGHVGMGSDLAKLLPEGAKVTLSGAMEDPNALRGELRKHPDKKSEYEAKIKIAELGEKLRGKCRQDPLARAIIDMAKRLEGLNRHVGVHAGGIVISNKPLVDVVPLCMSDDKRIATQFDMNDAEHAGLIKFDFLGLKTLTVIQNTLDQIERLPPHLRLDPVSKSGGQLDMAALPLDDSWIFAMICRGETTGVFQLESSGFKSLLQRLKPDRFEDIIAVVALYRPGPLEGGMVDRYIECKHGRRQIVYPHPLLADVLRDTYGVFIYQEQVIAAAKLLAGFSASAADIMRRAMGKKKPKEMMEQREKFVAGCMSVNSIDQKLANEIFDLIDKFSGYGFNLSHSCAYGMISYQTAFLKVYYPECFMAALMSCADKTDDVVKHIDEARAMGIKILQPDVNESLVRFGVVWGAAGRPAIRYALSAINDVGEAAAQDVVDSRGTGYTSIFDLCSKIAGAATKKSLEGLIRAGALDSISEGHDRARIVAAVPTALALGQQSRKARLSGQSSIFDTIADYEPPENVYPHAAPLLDKERLQWERAALGLYLTDHPLDRYRQIAERIGACQINAIKPSKTEVKLIALVAGIKDRQTKKTSEPMAIITLEDRSGSIEAVLFPRKWKEFSSIVTSIGTAPILATGTIEARDDESTQMVLRDIRRLSEPEEQIAAQAHMPAAKVARRIGTMATTNVELDDECIENLKRLIVNSHGRDAFHLLVTISDLATVDVIVGESVEINDGFIMAAERIFSSKMSIIDEEAP